MGVYLDYLNSNVSSETLAGVEEAEVYHFLNT